MTVTTEAAAIAGLEYIRSRAPAAPGRTLAFATLGTWLFDAVSGGYMLRTWIARGGLRQQRASDRLAPRVVFGHFGLASTGLLVWVSYLATRWIVLAWLAVGLLMVVIGLGVSTVTVWTPFPAHRAGSGTAPGDHAEGRPGDGDALIPPAEGALASELTDELLNRALTDEVLLSRLVEDVVTRSRAGPSMAARRHRAPMTALIPASHGVAAITTMVLAVLTAAGSAAR